jgi:AcrR family transcriptional regulator
MPAPPPQRLPKKTSKKTSKKVPTKTARAKAPPKPPKPARKKPAPSKKAPPPRTRLELDARRTQLIELGFDMFSRHPYDEVHIDQVAKKAGISKGLLYHYFPTKRDFYTATLRVAASQLLSEIEVDDSLPPLERLSTGLEHYLRFVERYADAYVALMRGGVGADPQVAAIIEETRGTCFSRLMEGLGTISPGSADAPSLPARDAMPLLRTALRGFVGFVEATSLEWAKSRDIPQAALVSLLVQVLLQTLQIVGKS